MWLCGARSKISVASAEVVYNDPLKVVEREEHRVILNEICADPERRSTVVRDRIDALEDYLKQLEGVDAELFAGDGEGSPSS